MPAPDKEPDPPRRDLRETIVFALVVTLLVIVGSVTIMGIVTAGLCGFEAECRLLGGYDPDDDAARHARNGAAADRGFVAAIVGFHFGEKAGRGR
jgi:hypothetical protein